MWIRVCCIMYKIYSIPLISVLFSNYSLIQGNCLYCPLTCSYTDEVCIGSCD